MSVTAMSDAPHPKTPRLRMFAGPNGSGKSTIKNQVPQELWGHYINPDDLEAHIKAALTSTMSAPMTRASTSTACKTAWPMAAIPSPKH